MIVTVNPSLPSIGTRGYHGIRVADEHCCECAPSACHFESRVTRSAWMDYEPVIACVLLVDVLDRPGKLPAGLYPELYECLTEVIIDGVDADEESACDLCVRGSLGRKAADLRFLPGEIDGGLHGTFAGLLTGRG